MPQPTAQEIRGLDPYTLMAVLGKRVIHPGGRRSTQELLRLAGFEPGQRILDVGCGVGTTAIEIARGFGAQVTAVDIDDRMLVRARRNVRREGMDGNVTVEHGDITSLDHPDDAFDRVLAEAVTMFVDRRQATSELTRVCKPGGRVLATEFLWRETPTEEAREAFLGQVCPGMRFDDLDDWLEIYRGAGLRDLEVATGPFKMMTARGFLKDEGLARSLAIMGRTLSRPAYVKKMSWLMPRMAKAVPYLGYVVIAGAKG